MMAISRILVMSEAIAKENGVHLLKLPPHTTHLQPLDLGVFNHLKHTWEPIVGQFT